jgi:hypothetical protein
MSNSRLAPPLTVVAFLVVAAVKAQSPTVAGRSYPPPADLAQLMKGIIYPSANVFFAAQGDDPAKIKLDSKPSVSPNLLTSTFGRWEAVENSAIALAEAATLLSIAGRKCSNGVDVPVKNPDWDKFVTELREAGLVAYKAAQTKNQESVLSAADVVTAACSSCHSKYRDNKGRCR